MCLPGFQLFRGGLALVLFLGLSARSHAALPPKPAAGDFLADYAEVLAETTRQKVRERQAATFQENRVPIVIVTVPDLRRYDLGTGEIESYARKWFDGWGIGSKQKNEGILVLLAVKERRARIELGAGWGNQWDDYAEKVMNGRMVPAFRSGDYGPGLLAGLEALQRMAARGAEAGPPRQNAWEKFADSQLGYYAIKDNPIRSQLGSSLIIAVGLAGAVSLLLACFFRAHRPLLIKVGFGLIGLALLFWIAAIIIGLVFGRRFQETSGTSDGGSGYDGGSSGGGGATGRW